MSFCFFWLTRWQTYNTNSVFGRYNLGHIKHSCCMFFLVKQNTQTFKSLHFYLFPKLFSPVSNHLDPLSPSPSLSTPRLPYVLSLFCKLPNLISVIFIFTHSLVLVLVLIFLFFIQIFISFLLNFLVLPLLFLCLCTCIIHVLHVPLLTSIRNLCSPFKCQNSTSALHLIC